MKPAMPPEDFVWTPAGTDITERWRLHYNWIPPSENPTFQKKWAYYQELPLRKLTAQARMEVEKLMVKNNIKRWRIT